MSKVLDSIVDDFFRSKRKNIKLFFRIRASGIYKTLFIVMRGKDRADNDWSSIQKELNKDSLVVLVRFASEELDTEDFRRFKKYMVEFGFKELELSNETNSMYSITCLNLGFFKRKLKFKRFCYEILTKVYKLDSIKKNEACLNYSLYSDPD